VDGLGGLLGRRWGDPIIEQALRARGVRRTPSLDEDAVVDWLTVRQHGFELCFEDAEHFAGRRRSGECDGGELLVTAVIFYNERHDMRRHRGALPVGLSWHQDRDTTRMLLNRSGWACTRYRRDVYESDGIRLIVAPRPGSEDIESIVLKMVHPPRSAVEDRPSKPCPSLDEFASAFGYTIAGAPFLALFDAGDIRDRLDELRLERTISFTEDGGHELYFQRAQALRTRQPGQAGLVFAGIQFHRHRDQGARQWAGELPFGLQFDDSPNDLFKKVPTLPAQCRESTLTGFAVWHFERFSLHVFYSTFENCIIRVFVMAPGFWESIGGPDD